MPNLTVAVIGAAGYAAKIGKRGTASDITFYNAKKERNTIACIEPSRYPERLSSLFHAVSLADMALLVVEAIDAAFAESVVMLDTLGIENGILVVRGSASPEEVSALVRGTVVEGYAVHADDPNRLRELLLGRAAEMQGFADNAHGSGAVAIDHAFPVKGVGTVALGNVTRGTVRVHDDLRVLPHAKEAHVRSIQKHDDDAGEASKGDRVGMALKGVEAEELERGVVLANDPSLEATRVVNGRVELVRYWRAPLREGMVVHLGHWMQFVPARIAHVDNSGDWRRPRVTFRAEKDLVLPPQARVLVHNLEAGKLRIAGRVMPE